VFTVKLFCLLSGIVRWRCSFYYPQYKLFLMISLVKKCKYHSVQCNFPQFSSLHWIIHILTKSPTVFVLAMVLLQTLVNDLYRVTGEPRDDIRLKTAIMSFINAALKCGAGQVSVSYHIVNPTYIGHYKKCWTDSNLLSLTVVNELKWLNLLIYWVHCEFCIVYLITSEMKFTGCIIIIMLRA